MSPKERQGIAKNLETRWELPEDQGSNEKEIKYDRQ